VKRILQVMAVCIIPMLFLAVVWQTVRYYELTVSIRELEVKQAKLIETLYMQEITKSIVSSRVRIDTYAQDFEAYTPVDPSRIIRIVPSVKKKNDG